MPRVWPISIGTLIRHRIVVTLASWRPLIPSGQAGVGRVIRSHLIRAQAARAVLLAPGDQHDVCRPPRAAGRSSRDACPAPRRQRSTIRAACTSQRPMVPSPRFDIRPSLSLPPLECCRGTSPSQAESGRPERNRAPSPIVAIGAVAVMTPTPGIAARRRLVWLDRGQAKSVAASRLIRARAERSCSTGMPSAARASGGRRPSPGLSMTATSSSAFDAP